MESNFTGQALMKWNTGREKEKQKDRYRERGREKQSGRLNKRQRE